MREGLVVSAHDLSEGGLAMGLAKSIIIGQGLGAEVNHNWRRNGSVIQ
ncbi:hypothetical protein R4Z10_07355 [Niallia sp. XMNu-256]